MKTSTANLHDFYEQPKNKVMNGPRPSPLMINNDSHLIRKPPVSSSIYQKQHKGPIIIYTESPKIIHTKAQDFMALVQRLTGMSSSTKEITTTAPQVSENFGSSLSDGDNSKSTIKKEEKVQWMQHGASDDEITSSALRRDDDHEITTCVKGGGANSNLNFADMPLFTPTAYDFFCSPSRPLYQFSDSSPYGILGSLISPSALGFIKDLPEY